MRIDVPVREVMQQTFWLGPAPGNATPGCREPAMRRLADCIATVRPAVADAGRGYDDRCLVWALTAIAAHLAAETGDAPLASALFRSSARLLELADHLPAAEL